MRWLRLEMRAPMASYGGPTIDAFGKTNDMPGRSMLTGLIANALGWERTDHEKHQQLQDRLAYGTAREEDPDAGRLTDYQTALLKKNDVAWTTSGRPAKRTSNAATFSGSHQRWRDYHTDIRMTVVMTLIPATKRPSLTEIAEAIDRPARPLFIGRGSCLPSRRILAGTVEASTVLDALKKAVNGTDGAVTIHYPAAPASPGQDGHRLIGITDERDWRSGLHGGERLLYTGRLEAGKTP